MAGQPTFDAREQVTDSEFGILPAWDLSDLYPAPDSAELTADIAQLETEAAAFAARYQGKLADLTPAEMLACIETYQRIDITAGRIMSYAGLRYYQNTTDAARAKMMGDLQGRITDITTPMSSVTVIRSRSAGLIVPSATSVVRTQSIRPPQYSEP